MIPIGYTTDFFGSVKIEPPLNADEVSYLKDFNHTRRMNRNKGPFYVKGTGFAGQDHEPDVRDYNNPPFGQPGLWCQWTPSDDGTEIHWDGGEKFYYASDWMIYIINEFLTNGRNVDAKIAADERFKNFTFDHVVNGEIEAQGEDPGDVWKLVVTNNAVTTLSGQVNYGTTTATATW